MSFDWTTLALQTVNLLVLIWLLRRFLFRPVTTMIAHRRTATEKMLADADACRQAASHEAERLAQERMKLAAEGDQIRDKARKAAEVEQSALMQQAQAEIAKARQAADIQVKQERTQMQRELESDARQLAVVIASHLLARFSQQLHAADLLQIPSNWLANLPQRDLQNLVEGGGTLEVVTAVALEPVAQAACSQILRQRLAREVNLAFRSAPELIAGVELRSPHGRLRNNWRADLDRILEELSRDEQHLAMA